MFIQELIKFIYTLFRLFLAICFVPSMYVIIGIIDLIEKNKQITSDLKNLLDWLMMKDFELIFNSHKENNNIAKFKKRKTEQIKSNLDVSINNLIELREKGILTQNEYYEKIDKINSEKEEQDFRNSKAYKQLKNLFDSDILTKEEFEIKVKLLLPP